MARKYGDGGYYENKHGEWFASVPNYAHGKRKTVRAKDKNDAKTKWRQLLIEREKGNATPARMTVAAFCVNWLENTATPNVKPATAEFYERVITCYIVPHIGTLYMDKVEPHHIDALLANLRTEFATQTLRHAYTVGRQIFTFALLRDYIKRNPFAFVKPPRVTAPTISPLTLAHGRVLLAATEAYPLYHVTSVLGLRRGEALGLRCCDFDSDTGTLTIAQQVQTIRGKLHIDTPKTETSARTLPLPDALITRLQPCLSDKELLFPCNRGTPIQPRNLDRQFKMLLRRTNLPETTRFHDLRHSVATWYAELGVHEVVIAAILGHSKGGSITRHYMHASMPLMQEAVDTLANALYGK